LIKTDLFLLNATFSMAVLDIISHLRFASFVILVPKEFKYSKIPSCFGPIVICVEDG